MIWSRIARAGARTVLAVVLGSSSLVGWQAKPVSAGTGRILGTVKSAADGTPLARARVLAVGAQSPEPRVAISGADGKYAIADLPAGSYTISVTRTGFAPQTYGQGRQVAGVPVTLADGQQAVDIDVALVPGRSIGGRILDEDGSPFAGAVVEALVSRFDAGTDTLVAVATSQTDDRGEFRLFGLAPGQYYVSASDPAFRSVTTTKGVLRYSPTYYPGVSAVDQARPVAVPASGDAPRVEFRLKLVPPARVSGQLVTEDGEPLLNGAIVLSQADDEGLPIVPAGEPSLLPDGRFSFRDVVPGRYQIRARGQTDPKAATLFAVFALDVLGADVEHVRMTLRPGAVFEGKIRIQSTRGLKPPPFHTLRVRAPFTNGNSFGDALTGTVQPDRQFTLRGIMRGPHQLVVEGLQPPWVVKTILYRGRDIVDRQIDVSEKEQFRDIRIIITDASSMVAGVVQNVQNGTNLPVANAGVIVFPRVPLFWMRSSRRMRITYTDDTGRFSLPGLPAGEYLAVASMSIDEGDLGRRNRLRALESIGVPFRLESDEAQATVTLPLVSPASIAAAGLR